jgi:hypothetical protein
VSGDGAEVGPAVDRPAFSGAARVDGQEVLDISPTMIESMFKVSGATNPTRKQKRLKFRKVYRMLEDLADDCAKPKPKKMLRSSALKKVKAIMDEITPEYRMRAKSSE